MSSAPIIVKQVFPVQPDAVWQAITNPVLMRGWYFEPIGDFQPEVGFEIRFDIESGGRVFRHRWRVSEVVPGESITYTWRYGGFPGLLSTEWRLSKVDGGAKLVLVCTGIESFPQDIPEFRPESCKAGWEYFIRQRLTNFLKRAS